MYRHSLGSESHESVEEYAKDFVRFIGREPFSDKTRELANVIRVANAAMAEALVNLTALKRRVSREAETVGGPIDVAVVSKGDGFIWIKRKHYFDPALNSGYFRRRP